MQVRVAVDIAKCIQCPSPVGICKAGAVIPLLPKVAGAIHIQQGQWAKRQGQTINDMAFRPALTDLREQWEEIIGGLKNPADGFFLIHELRSPRKHQRYPQSLIDAYQAAITAISQTIQMPIDLDSSKWTGNLRWRPDTATLR